MGIVSCLVVQVVHETYLPAICLGLVCLEGKELMEVYFLLVAPAFVLLALVQAASRIFHLFRLEPRACDHLLFSATMVWTSLLGLVPDPESTC